MQALAKARPARAAAPPRPAPKVSRKTKLRVPRWLRAVANHKLWLLAGGALLTLATGGTWAWQQGLWSEAVVFAARTTTDVILGAQVAAGLVVHEVTVEGREQTAAADLLSAVAVQRGGLMLDFDAAAARARIEKLGWVRTASVSRLWPDRIHVDVTERVPFVLWQNERRLTLIDRDGVVITDRGLGRFSSLPMIVGTDAAPLAGSLLDTLAQAPALKARVRAAVRVGRRRWDIHFDNGVIAQLPEQDVPAAWTRLAELDAQHQLLDRMVTVIDLRLPDRLVLRLDPSLLAKPAPVAKPPAKSAPAPLRGVAKGA